MLSARAPKLKPADYQQRVVLLKKPAETVGKGGVRLLPVTRRNF